MFNETDPRILESIREISGTYDIVASAIEKKKRLFKFGRSDDLGTSSEMVWTNGGLEILPTGNTIDRAVSTDAGDDAVIGYEVHTIDGDNKATFYVRTVTVNGVTPVVIEGVGRVSRAYVVSGTLNGDFTIYESGNAQEHIQILGSLGDRQSFKCATTISDKDFGLLSGLTVSVGKKTAATVDFTLELAPIGGIFRPISGLVSVSSAGASTFQDKFDPFVIIPNNHDVRMVAVSSATATRVSARLDLRLLIDLAKVNGI